MGKTTRPICRLQTMSETERATGDRSLMRHLRDQEAALGKPFPFSGLGIWLRLATGPQGQQRCKMQKPERPKRCDFLCRAVGTMVVLPSVGQ
jgi:hypothetical protein